MTYSRSMVILLGVLFCAGVVCARAAGADTDGRLAQSLAAALKPGMTNSAVEQTVSRLIPGDEWGGSTSLGRHRAVSRYNLGDGVYVLADFNDVGDEQGNLRPGDRLSSVEVARFDDLKGKVPDDLFPAVRLAHLAPSIAETRFDPTALIRTVNGMLPLGKDKALKALRAYDELTRDRGRAFRYDMDSQRIFLIVRLLFVRTDGAAQMPWVGLGGTQPDVKMGDPNWPLFPLVLQNDIPFCLSSGYSLFGVAEEPSAHLNYCEQHCIIRSAPLRPSASPVAAVSTVCDSARWHRLFKNAAAGADTQFLLRVQALRSLTGITGKMPDPEEFCPSCVSTEGADRAWAGYVGDSLKTAEWDSEKQQFVGRKTSPSPK